MYVELRGFACARTGGWTASHSDPAPWIQADLDSVYVLESVTTQGRQDFFEYTSSYVISYGDNESALIEISEVYPANWDLNTKVTNELPPDTVGRYVRLHLRSWFNGPALRWDVKGKMQRKPRYKQYK